MQEPIELEGRIVAVSHHMTDTEEDTPARIHEGLVRPETTQAQIHEGLVRPETLEGKTYKIKIGDTPALYVTINDIVLRQAERVQRHPFEIFINSKNMQDFQWIVALTRVMSAVFRKGGDVTFLIEEMLSVYDPRGGHFRRGGRYMPSIVAEIGDVLQRHMEDCGLVKQRTAPHAGDDRPGTRPSEREDDGNERNERNKRSTTLAAWCAKCQQKAVVMSEGCMTCMACGDSKCG